jgi:hypothetical protein
MPAIYRIYRRWGRDGADELLTTVAAGLGTVTLAGMAAGSRQWLSVRAVSAQGVIDGGPVRLVRAAFDGSAELIASAPNAPSGLTLAAEAGGVVRASWRYDATRQEVAPTKFHVYVAQGDAAVNFTSPLVIVGYASAQSHSTGLGSFADGTLVRCVVRSVSEDDVEDQNQAEAVTWARAAIAGGAVASIDAEVVAE